MCVCISNGILSKYQHETHVCIIITQTIPRVRLINAPPPTPPQVQTKRKLWITIAVMYLPCMMCPVPSIFDVSYDNGTCREHGKPTHATIVTVIVTV